MSGSLARLFAPKSIAIVGASAAPSKPGYAAMQALAGFHGELARGKDVADQVEHDREAGLSDSPEFAIRQMAKPGKKAQRI